MNLNEIMLRIPHRYPMLLLDKVLEIVAKESIIAVKNVSVNEPYFIGHFPRHSIMPGVLIVEALAQAGGLLVVDSFSGTEYQGLCMLAGIKGVRFKARVIPGDQLTLHATLLKYKSNIAKLSAVAKVCNNEVARVSEMTLICKE